MLNFLKKHWKKIAIVGLLMAVVIGLYIKSKTAPQIGPTPTPIEFKLLRSFPVQGDVELAFPGSSVIFYFSTAVQKDKVSVVINPTIPFTLTTIDSDKTVVINPSQPWKFNTTYNFKLMVISQTGQTLPEIQYAFTPVSPKNSDMTD